MELIQFYICFHIATPKSHGAVVNLGARVWVPGWNIISYIPYIYGISLYPYLIDMEDT